MHIVVMGKKHLYLVPQYRKIFIVLVLAFFTLHCMSHQNIYDESDI